MRQPKGRQAPNTTAQITSARGRVTILPAASPPDLAAAVARWSRLAGSGPAAECGTAWCSDCWTADDNMPDMPMFPAGDHYHHSLTATVTALSVAGVNFPDRLDIDVQVERYNLADGTPERPTVVAVMLTDRRSDLSPGQARRIAVALAKAVQGTGRLAGHTSEYLGGTTGVVSVVRLEDEVLHVGAVVEDADPAVFINYVPNPSAGHVRYAVRRGRAQYDQPVTWDLSPASAATLAAALSVAADVAEADRYSYARPAVSNVAA